MSSGVLRRIAWQRIAGVAGAILMIAGGQALVYERTASRLAGASATQLSALRLEVADNREINAGLRALQKAWEASADDGMRRDFIALRDRVGERFLLDRAAAVDDFVSTVATFANEDGGQEMRALQRQAQRVASIYANQSQRALSFVEGPPMYLQPCAAFSGNELRARLRYNIALHAMLIGDNDDALEQLLVLRRESRQPQEQARIDFALARLHYARFAETGAVDGLGQALTMVRESLRSDPRQELSLLLLDYLLAIDSSAKLLEMDSVEGSGSGQGEGERGALSSGEGEF